jgi:lipid II:glycine glycyltransferase (peptidoglycan interpeptide bridge formation enzyme)
MLVRPVRREEHLAFVTARGSASFLQLPSWGLVKSEWRAESLGWFTDDGTMVGVGLVLHRQLPAVRRSLAYLPEGPVLDWSQVVADPAAWLDPLVAHLRRAGAFGVRMGPPVVTSRWSAETLKQAVAEGKAQRLGDVPPTEVEQLGTELQRVLAARGWRAPREAGGFTAGQPRHVFQLPLAGKTEADVLKGFNQLWRRNVKKAEKEGVEVTHGTVEDLPSFHALYLETAARDGFTPRPLSYFARMWRAMSNEDPGRMTVLLARRRGTLLAATTLVRVGTHAWYSYGASSTVGREYRGSNAVQWQMIRESLAAGCTVYDLRGITDTLSADDPHFGLIQFKLGTGGEAVEYVGEWDLPLNRLLYKGFETYMSRRG